MKPPEPSYSPGPFMRNGSLSPRDVTSEPLCSGLFKETRVISEPNRVALSFESLEIGLTAMVVSPKLTLKKAQAVVCDYHNALSLAHYDKFFQPLRLVAEKATMFNL